MRNTHIIWFLVAAIEAVMAVLDLVSRQNWIVVGYRFLAALLFAGLGLLQPYCLKRGPGGKKLFYGIAAASVVLLLLVLALFLC
ncbi:hypothetical protein ACTQ33_10420 [Candidatus Avoscillospira sp. LCP25S3_F1]|uniref:hypothetical protein n=1 Tax=Candidatus Avoscillospira sp. LCP25S3_F1 TaxID=3438825 RepID=UPI003F90457D